MKGRVGAPHKAVMGWIEPGGSRKDAVEYARGYAVKHMDAPEGCWFEVLPFLGGYLWEVHELGPGLSYLPATAKVLSDPLAKGWFRTRKRAFQVAIQDGRPSLVLLPETLSKSVMENPKGEMRPSGKMRPVIRKGTRVLAFGSSVFGAGAVFLGATYAYAFLSLAYAPEPRRLDQDLLPHRQWSRVERVPPNLFVESMRFKEQAWTTNIKPVMRNASGRPTGGTANAGQPQPAAAATPPRPAAPPPPAPLPGVASPQAKP